MFYFGLLFRNKWKTFFDGKVSIFSISSFTWNKNKKNYNSSSSKKKWRRKKNGIFWFGNNDEIAFLIFDPKSVKWRVRLWNFFLRKSGNWVMSNTENFAFLECCWECARGEVTILRGFCVLTTIRSPPSKIKTINRIWSIFSLDFYLIYSYLRLIEYEMKASNLNGMYS